MTTTETLKLALEALKQIDEAMPFPVAKLAQSALREALAEQPAQQQEPVAWLIWLHGPAGHFDHKQFAELEFERRNKEYPDPDRKLLPLYTSPPAQQEPFGYFRYDLRLDAWVQNREGRPGTAFYTSPPQRPWVGLTDEEKADLFEGTAPYYNETDYADAIEAKLKEKNT